MKNLYSWGGGYKGKLGYGDIENIMSVKINSWVYDNIKFVKIECGKWSFCIINW